MIFSVMMKVVYMENKNLIILALTVIILVLLGIFVGISLNSNNTQETNNSVNITLNDTNDTLNESTNDTNENSKTVSNSKKKSTNTKSKESSSKPLVEGVDYDSSKMSYEEYERKVKNNPAGHYDLEGNYYKRGEGQ